MTTENLFSSWNQGVRTLQAVTVAAEKAWDEAVGQQLERMEAACRGSFDLFRSTLETARKGRQAMLAACENTQKAWENLAPAAAGK